MSKNIFNLNSIVISDIQNYVFIQSVLINVSDLKSGIIMGNSPGKQSIRYAKFVCKNSLFKFRLRCCRSITFIHNPLIIKLFSDEAENFRIMVRIYRSFVC